MDNHQAIQLLNFLTGAEWKLDERTPGGMVFSAPGRLRVRVCNDGSFGYERRHDFWYWCETIEECVQPDLSGAPSHAALH